VHRCSRFHYSLPLKIAAITRGLRLPWMTATTPEGLFFRRVGNQVFAHQKEAERLRSEVRAFVALIGKRNHGANSAKNIFAHTAGRKGIIFRDVFPNLGDVLRRKRMKAKTLLSGY
jgi:hypothetical protein